MIVIPIEQLILLVYFLFKKKFWSNKNPYIMQDILIKDLLK
jgi:hypothetical protein